MFQGILAGAFAALVFPSVGALGSGSVSSPVECTWGATIHVSTAGKNWWDGSEAKPVLTIQKAVQLAKKLPCAVIKVSSGTYQNTYFGKSKNHNNKVVDLNGVEGLKLEGVCDPKCPVLEFDGPGGIMGGYTNKPVKNVEISNFEIRGPAKEITLEEATSKRLGDYSYYEGKGIALWAAERVYIHDVEVHDCPGSGIRVNKGDYITIDHCKVYDNTFWSPSAESAIVLAEAKSVDELTNKVKMSLTTNLVYGNMNKIPYYNKNYKCSYSPLQKDCPVSACCEGGDPDGKAIDNGCPLNCKYGKTTQDYIIDGSGVYVTRNDDTYLHGKFDLSYNSCFENGLNGLVVHRTDRAVVKKNVLYDNGVGFARQPYSGLVLNNALDVAVWSNRVQAGSDAEYAYIQVWDAGADKMAVKAGGNNRYCKGLVKIDMTNQPIKEDVQDVCKYAKVECGEHCHIIQWPYNMKSHLTKNEAFEECAKACNAGDCKAFSLQDDYSGVSDKRCFTYKASAEPNPAACADDPFDKPGCVYGTKNGEFYIKADAKYKYNVHDRASTRRLMSWV